jgi:DMSO/TMAO reductase YedYZ heme-binding membrane subunit
MRPDKSEYVTLISVELAWLLGSWAFSFVLLGLVVGFNRLAAGPLDIQMHNQYFVLSTGYAVFPIFVFVATIVTVVRGVLGRFKQNNIKAVLGLLAIVWVFLLLVIFTLAKNMQ